MASETEELNFEFYLISGNFDLNHRMWPESAIVGRWHLKWVLRRG